MGKSNKQKRMREIADKVLESELKRNSQEISSAVPDSALFTADEDVTKRKKILIHPKPEIDANPKPVPVQYTDIWSTPMQAKPTKKQERTSLKPKTSESYRSESLVKAPKPKEQLPSAPVFDPADEAGPHDDGMGDTFAGDKPAELKMDREVKCPTTKEKERKDVQIANNIPPYLPQEIKDELRKKNKESFAKLRQMEEEKLKPAFEKTKEEAEELQKKLKQIEERPKKEKSIPHERFIADEPELSVESVPASLKDIQPDQKPFARMQRDLEVKGKVTLH